MPGAAVNHYKADLRAIQFTLYEHLHVEQLFALAAFSHLSREECDATIDQCLRFVNEYTGPLNGPADRAGCVLENGVTRTPAGFKEAWRKLFELGFMSFPMPLDAGGFGGPHALTVVIEELQSGANTAFNMYQGLTHGAADLIEVFALPEVKARFLPPMMEGRFSGTMCLSESHAGSDVGATTTRAQHLEGNIYAISGTKCWISAGDHDLPENIVHLVLARIEGAPAGTKGLSLFIVPKIWVNEDGSLGAPNDVVTASIEHKLGIRASATAVLNFGESGGCRGILVGGEPNMGMRQMFRMMNGARIVVGVQGLAVASTAYLNALAYARERLQGSSVKHFKDPNAPRVPIIAHADVRRMLIEMKAKVEGMRSPTRSPTPTRRRPSITRARSTSSRPSSRRTARTRRSASPSWRSRRTAAPATSPTIPSSSTAATPRSSPSTRGPTTSRRSTSSPASCRSTAARTSGTSSRRSPISSPPTRAYRASAPRCARSVRPPTRSSARRARSWSSS
jgi:alkylation response protein AidB-like acyl-CoA dehydrogenase